MTGRNELQGFGAEGDELVVVCAVEHFPETAAGVAELIVKAAGNVFRDCCPTGSGRCAGTAGVQPAGGLGLW